MAEKIRVLVISHTTAGQMYMGVLLSRMWYSPTLAKTSQEGIRIAQGESFSLIMLDGDLQEGDRNAAVSSLKNDPAVKHIPLVVFIADESGAAYESLTSQGCSAVITKPLDLALTYGVIGWLSGNPRHTPRISVRFRVEIEENVPEKVLTCINLSEGGLYLRTHQPLPEKTVLHLKFTLPHDTEIIEVAAEVVRTAPLGAQIETEPGMGLRFVGLPEATRQRLRNFVQWELMGDLEWEAKMSTV